MKLDRRSFVTGASAVGVLAALGGYFLLNDTPDGGLGPTDASAAPGDVDLQALLEPGPLGDMALGEEDAPVTVIEYASMTCPHCASFHGGTFPQLKEKYVDTGKVRFIFREFPFDDLALAAFMVARCTPEEKYFPLIDVMFERQETWTARDGDPREELFNIARSAGMTREDFDACLKDEEVARGIMAVRERAANEFGVESTPTFFVDGKILRGNQPIARFDEMITS